ncbi:arylamine N-acetyltransferase family protein [Vallitalea okinawensis]|uniref:arylamine N-acetyltransferase family protein n=1 Tax=Vallitalea okinawensis TaxID=2078660 RepID=UPI000CFB5F92|nr:arylamine N-acetyltransferase [Vallitalea okinawensis]
MDKCYVFVHFCYLDEYIRKMVIPVNIDDYLRRIGISDEILPNLKSLRLIHRQHLQSVPFENLDVHLYNSINLDEESLFNKIVSRNRGGICYELNYLLYLLLAKIGFKVILLGGKVLEENGSYYDHLLIKTRIHSEEYLVDVGFGDNYFEPLKFICDLEQEDLKGMFKIEKVSKTSYKLCHKVEEVYQPVYTFINIEKTIEDFDERIAYFTQSPDSLFRKNLFCSIEKTSGRTSLKQDKIIITNNNSKKEYKVVSVKNYYEHLRSKFKLHLTPKELDSIDKLFFN